MTQPALTIPFRPESIALIDISYLFKKRFHTTNGSKMAAARATLEDLEGLKRGVGHVIICRDAPPYSHRLAIHPEYKANRPLPEPEERAQKQWLWAEVKRLGYNVGWCQGYEADDVIATLAKHYAVWCDDVRIVGPDKDAAQCLTERVRQFIPPVATRDWEVRDVAAATKKFGVPPELMTLYQGLAGDSGDNIPGVPKVGPKTAAELANKYRTVQALAQGLATEAAAQGSKPGAVLQSLAAHWDTLILSVKLATLDTNVPVDAEALLVKREAEAAAPARNDMDIELDGFVGNETPMPEKPKDPALEEASRHYQDFVARARTAENEVSSTPSDAQVEAEYDRERASNGEYEAQEVRLQTATAKVEVMAPPKTQPATTTALATAPQSSKYGIVTADLQPTDLISAYHVSEWICKSQLYKAFTTPAQVFTIIARGKELGIGMTTALAGFHMVEGKPSASADLIRALVERDPNFEYLMPTEMSATSVTWEGKHKKQPRPVKYTYTIEDARLAGLIKSGNYGATGNWAKRPQDMLMKTAGSKLARILWPGATLGCYCPEEMGYTAEELDAREAA